MPETPTRPDFVFVILIDCLRADHVQACGYHRPTTPNLDRLASGGILWERAYSTSSWTKPSVASLLTGLYPSGHEVFEGIKRQLQSPMVTTDALRVSSPTLAEQLTRAGWRCGAFINNAQLGEFSGLSRGFEYYNADSGKADQILDLLWGWLIHDRSRPCFAYLHFLEAHWPYKPRRKHVAMFGGNRDTNTFGNFSARDYGRLRKAVSRGDAALSAGQLEEMVQMYDGAIRRLDEKLGKLLAWLEENGMTERSAVIVTADHGEEFLEHGRIGHGHSLYEEVVHVPLVAALPPGSASVSSTRPSPGRSSDSPQRAATDTGAVRISQPVSLVDLAPTILKLTGVGPANGPDLLQPRSVRPVAAELRAGRRYAQFVREGDWKLHRKLVFEDRDAIRGITPRQAAASIPHKAEFELYHCPGDLREQVNRAGDPTIAPVFREMTRALDTWWAHSAPNASESGISEVTIDSAIVGRLRALGYVG